VAVQARFNIPYSALRINVTRLPDWQTRLDRFILDNRDRLFQYGSWDCCLFACGAIESMTGIDIAVPFRGRYSTRRGAFELAREHCGQPTIEALAAHVARDNGMPEVNPGAASRGDLVMVQRTLGQSMGVVALNGRQIIVVGQLSRNNEVGLGPISMWRAVRAWRV
jgi:hypothetical protein